MNFQKARFITKNDKDALRQLYGFIFGDGKLCVYEYRSFGKTNYNRKLTPILNRGVYHYQHGARQNEPYAKERFTNTHMYLQVHTGTYMYFHYIDFI